MPKYSLQAPPPPAPAPVQPAPAAPSWRRGSAFIFDSLPAFVLFVLLCALFLPAFPLADLISDPTASAPLPETPSAVLMELYIYLIAVLRMSFFAWIGYAAWHIFFEAQYGTTPGKWLVGLRVASTKSPASCPPQEGLGWKLASIRFFAAGISWAVLNIGHAMGRWRADRAMLHDLLSNTRVVVDPNVEMPVLGPGRKDLQLPFAIGAWILVVVICVYKVVIFTQTLNRMLTLV